MTYEISSKDSVEIKCRREIVVIGGKEIERGNIIITYKDFSSAYAAHKKMWDETMKDVVLPTFD